MHEQDEVPAGGLKSTATAINDSGQIVGSAATGTGATDGFLYTNGTMTDLGSFTPAAINNNGVMVGGQYIDSGGIIQNLNSLLPAGSPTIQDATGINDNGQIVAASSNGAVLLTPN
jgi:probable HAF family extracellular repeat protein